MLIRKSAKKAHSCGGTEAAQGCRKNVNPLILMGK
jgi:hypothetical protein